MYFADSESTRQRVLEESCEVCRNNQADRWRHVQEADADVPVDVDCCGDSGSMSKLCSAAPLLCLKRSLLNSAVSATSHEGVKAQASVRRSAPISTDVDMVSSQLCDLSHLSCYEPASSCTHAHALLQPALCIQTCETNVMLRRLWRAGRCEPASGHHAKDAACQE